MQYSLAEIDAVSKKAARGSGFSWGLSEEAGKAVRYLCSFQLPGPQLLADYLQQIQRPEFVTGPPVFTPASWSSSLDCLCPLSSGAALADLITTFNSDRPLQLRDCASPLLMAAVTAIAITRQQRSLSFQWNTVRLTLHPQGLDREGPQDELLSPMVSEVLVTVVPSTGAAIGPAVLPAEVDEVSWQQLNDLAFRTYVPSSETSRAGAGSKLSDND